MSYLAGLFDAEGHVNLSNFSLVISNTDLILLMRYYELLESNEVNCHI